MDTPAKLEFVRRYLQALCDGDLSTIKGFFDEKSTLEDPYGSRCLEGVDRIGAFYQKAVAQGVSATQTGEARCCGDSVAVPYRVKVGPVQINAITVFQFADDGTLKSMRAYYGPENVTTA
ncbi:MAG TPA: nuclear transport factor 2 family protein [Steroidobacteraceae bacterium]|nr:nuclear transport factor 2 family protein [Steroidobacteraceae bacterium]